MRSIAIALCYDIPGLQVYLFRRTYPDLIANHMNGSGSFLELLAPFVESKQVSIKQDEISWSNGSKIHLCHCQHEKDVLKYQGAEIHVLLVDELTSFTEYIYRFLRNRVRLGSRVIPERWKKKLPLIICGSNPGGVGHAWVKRSFIEMIEPGAIRQMPDTEGGMVRQFIQSKSDDNPIGMKNDPGYIARLTGLGSESLVRAMRDGDWDIVAGAAFENLSRDKHMVRAFEIPHWWTKFTSLDWGSAKPYAMGWYAVADDVVVLKGRDGAPDKSIGKGSIIKYRELYGWNGRADEGCREESWEVARKIKALEPSGETINYRIADSAMWAEHDGPSIAERMMDALERENAVCPNMEQSRKDRKANYLEMRNRISNSDGENPGFYVFETCHHFWRTVPELQLDQRDPEKGWDSAQEDHCFVDGTLIITAHGLIPIEKILTGEMVLTTRGYLPCKQLRMTAITETVKIVCSDGYEFVCTPNHPVLTTGGNYNRIDLLTQMDMICKLKSSMTPRRALMIKAIGFVDFIIKDMAKGFIVLFGSITMATSKKVFMSIMLMATGVITLLRTLSLCVEENIYRFICKQKKESPHLENTLRLQELLHQYGIKAKKVGSGIARLCLAGRLKQNLKSNVMSAIKNLWQKQKELFFARMFARLENGGVSILDISAGSVRPVYNLRVDGPENYCLENGMVVHNCADETGYALVSRPILMDRKTFIKKEYDEARDKAFQADRGGKANTSKY